MEFKEEVSVIIPTFNGAPKIIALLRNLSNQTFQSFRVYIGIDGSTDNTRKILESQSFFLKYRIIIHEQSNKGRSIIRNKTAEIAKGNILLFLDDDIEPENRLIEKHYMHHKENRNSILGGAVFDEIRENKSDFLKYKSYLSIEWMKNYENKAQLLDDSNLFLTAANFSIPNKLFKQLKGFDEQLTDGEDWDFSVKAMEQGFNIYFDPTITSYHINSVTLKVDIQRQREYIKAHILLIKNNPNLYNKKYNRIGIPNLNFSRRLIYWLLARKYNVSIVDHLNIYRILPRKIRYTIYTIIRTGLGRIYINRKF